MRDISDFKTVGAVLASPDFSAVEMASIYSAIAARTGLDFAASIRVINLLPPFLNGERHQRVRKAMATMIADGRDRQTVAVATGLDALVAARFCRNGSFDLIADFAQPLWRGLSAGLIGYEDKAAADAISALAEQIPTLFSTTVSLARRKTVDDHIAAFIAEDLATADDRLLTLCLSALGSRPFVGSFALSIFDVVSAQGPARACAMDWPANFSEGALEYADRLPGRDQHIGDTCFAAGEPVRTLLRHDSFTPEQKHQLLFGTGAHGCLGRSISRYAWTAFVERMGDVSAVLSPVELTMARSSDPFRMPARAVIAVTRT